EQWVPHPSFLRVRILSMRNPLRRYYGRRDLHFVTFSCYPCRPYLGTKRARDRFVKVLDQLLRGLRVEPAPRFAFTGNSRSSVTWLCPSTSICSWVSLPGATPPKSCRS